MNTAHLTRTGGECAGIGAVGVLAGELLCEAVDIHPGEIVLDVAAGDGATALAAARRGADVVATDLADEALAAIAILAHVSGLGVRTEVADPQNLQFNDDTFDAVMSTFGAMFAPDQQLVADELVRVCRPGGRIGLVNWAPNSLIGDVFMATSRHVPPPPGLRPPIEWGSEGRLREVFGNRIRSLRIETRQLTFRCRSAQHMLDWFRSCYGPTQAAFASLDRDGRARLAGDLVDIYTFYNRADDGTFVGPSDYVEVVAVVR